ncbi:MAG: polysaccharide deacetylase family protein [Deltaproteobacteria bacterium]|nr:polysaccharide deacetylase family protein [Deltaproteobacteria bacterium]
MRICLAYFAKKGIPAIFFVNTKPIEEDFVTVTHKIHILRARTPPDKLLAILKQILSRENIAFELPDSAIARSIYKFDSAEAAKLKYFLNYVLNENQQKLVIDRSFNILGFDQARMSNDLYMTKDMIVKLALTGALGTHGHAHRPLGLLEKNIAIADFDISINKLKEWTGKDMLAFSYPFGFYEACSKAVADYAMNNHIKFAFTLERAGNKKLDTPMFLGRFSPNDIFIGNTSYCPITFWNGLTDTVWFK